jgi:hypothetical protein
MTQITLGDRAHLSRQTVGTAINSDLATPRTVKRLAKALDVPEAALLSDSYTHWEPAPDAPESTDGSATTVAGRELEEFVSSMDRIIVTLRRFQRARVVRAGRKAMSAGEFLALLVLGAVSGLAFFAYHDPEGYDRLFPPFMYLAVAVTIVLVVWHTAIEKLYMRLAPLIPPERVGEAARARNSIQLDLGLTLLACLGVLGYLLFLAWLSDWRGRRRDERTRELK